MRKLKNARKENIRKSEAKSVQSNNKRLLLNRLRKDFHGGFLGEIHRDKAMRVKTTIMGQKAKAAKLGGGPNWARDQFPN